MLLVGIMGFSFRSKSQGGRPFTIDATNRTAFGKRANRRAKRLACCLSIPSKRK